jgi:hypothetical protein
MTIKSLEFWDSNYYKNPVLSEQMIEHAQQKLGVKLPDLFIELLKIQNGGYTRGFAFPMKTKTSWSENHVPLNELFGIVLDENLNSGHNILLSEYMIKEWGLPQNQVLLTGEGLWWITLDYRFGEIPTVRWLDTECAEDIHIADNFKDFINGLLPENEIL